ncbi:MAG: DHH family phosphoesterase [Elusimicrobiota bacterium]
MPVQKESKKSLLDRRLDSLKGIKTALILPHDNPDPDAIAASWGLAYLLKRDLRITSVIAYGGLIGRAENRAMVKILKIPIVPFHSSMLEKNEIIILIDCQPYTGNSSLPQNVVPDVIIDHHPLRSTTKYKKWAYIKKNTGATSTIISSFLQHRNLDIPQSIATALFYAIRSETRELGRMASRKDYETYLHLFPRVDFDRLHRITYPPLSPEFYHSVRQAISQSQVFRHAVVCPLGDVPYPELAAEMADFLVLREKIEFSLVMGRYNKALYLSLRSLHPEINAGELVRTITEGLGTGGGHGVMAGGKIEGIPAKKTKEIQSTLTERFLKCLSISRVKAKKLF